MWHADPWYSDPFFMDAQEREQEARDAAMGLPANAAVPTREL